MKLIKTIKVAFLLILFYNGEAQTEYATIITCDTCDVSPYLGEYRYVSYSKIDTPKVYMRTNWISFNNDDRIILNKDKFQYGDHTFIEKPMYSIDYYRIDKRGEPYFDSNKFHRHLSFYDKFYDSYGDYVYFMSVRDPNEETIDNRPRYFFEIHANGEKIEKVSNKMYFLLEKINK